jgi:NAD(P)-dependent dehydrogenase (short-subunit alcohol dehydrogenase family)
MPSKSFGRPIDIAEVIAFLVDQRSRFITGQMIVVDGGFTAR